MANKIDCSESIRLLKSIGGEGENMNSVLRRYSNAVDLENLDEPDEFSEDVSEDHIKDQVGSATQKMLQPLRDQVANMGIDVAVLDETLQTLIAQTEGANKKLTQVTNFVVDLIERLEDIDDKARSLTEKWAEESRMMYDFADHADDISDRFAKTIAIQEEKMGQLTELISTLTEETTRLTAISAPRQLPPPGPAPAAVKELLVEDPEMVDFKSKKAAFFALAEQRKSNDTYQSFKATRKSSVVTMTSSTNCEATSERSREASIKSDDAEITENEVIENPSSPTLNETSEDCAPSPPEDKLQEPFSTETLTEGDQIQNNTQQSEPTEMSKVPKKDIKKTFKWCLKIHFIVILFVPMVWFLLCHAPAKPHEVYKDLKELPQRIFENVIISIQGSEGSASNIAEL